MEREIQKKDNFISIEMREGEEVHINVAGEDLVFISPIDGHLNCYLKRVLRPIQYK
jgi:hypothetical protein